MNAVLTEEQPVEVPELNALARCDADGAQAYTVWEGPTKEGTTGHLLFCAHHHRKFELGLMAKGFRMVSDNREAINIEPSPSTNAA